MPTRRNKKSASDWAWINSVELWSESHDQYFEQCILGEALFKFFSPKNSSKDLIFFLLGRV